MNEFKFKAYHKKENILCDVKILTNEGAFLIGVKKGEDEFYNEGKRHVPAPEDGRFCKNEEIELMQGTGIIAKDNKEIHINNICKYYDWLKQEEAVGKVVYKAGAIWFWNNGQIRSFSSIVSEPNYILPSSSIEVIGNYFQNPELLNSNKK